MFPVFTPEQARIISEERTAKDALRARGLAETTKELLATKDEVEREFKEMMERHRMEAEDFYNKQVLVRKELELEVEVLEERRRIALTPPLIKAEDIHSVQEELHARKLELDLRESETEERSRLVMRQMDSNSSQKQDLDMREKRIERMEHGAETQKNQVAESARLMNLHMESFEERMATKETEFAYKQSELDARENLANEREHMFEKREDEIRAGTRLLEDRRILLEKGFEEFRRLKNKHDN